MSIFDFFLRRNLKIGLALSGGATLGAAHIGVLKVLEREGIKPSFVAGTSSGALVGAEYCVGIPVDQFSVGLRAILDANAAQPMQAVDVVTGCQQQMHVVTLDRIQFRFALPIRHHGHSQHVGGERLELGSAGSLVAGGNTVVVRRVPFGQRDLDVVERGGLFHGNGLGVILAQAKADDGIAGLGRLPVHDDPAGVAGLVGQPEPRDLSR